MGLSDGRNEQILTGEDILNIPIDDVTEKLLTIHDGLYPEAIGLSTLEKLIKLAQFHRYYLEEFLKGKIPNIPISSEWIPQDLIEKSDHLQTLDSTLVEKVIGALFYRFHNIDSNLVNWSPALPYPVRKNKYLTMPYLDKVAAKITLNGVDTWVEVHGAVLYGAKNTMFRTIVIAVEDTTYTPEHPDLIFDYPKTIYTLITLVAPSSNASQPQSLSFCSAHDCTDFPWKYLMGDALEESITKLMDAFS